MMIQYKSEIANLKSKNEQVSQVIENLKKSSKGKKYEELELKNLELKEYCQKLTQLRSPNTDENVNTLNRLREYEEIVAM